MDREKVRTMTAAFEAALKPLEGQFGVKIATGGARFSASNVTFSIEAAEVAADGLVQTKEAQAFKCYAEAFGLKKDDLGREFVHRGVVYQIVGLASRASKRPILARIKDNGKTYKFPERLVATLLGYKPAVPAVTGHGNAW